MTQPGRIASSEALLDAAVEDTFPASDPISIDHAFNAAREREEGAGEASARAAASMKNIGLNHQ